MARILIVGVDPDCVDFSDPALPPGLDAEKIRGGIQTVLLQLTAAGHEPAHDYIPSDPMKLGALGNRLRDERFDCVVIGGGVRLPPANLALFEAVLNVIAATEPAPRIALTATPHDAAAAAERALKL